MIKKILGHGESDGLIIFTKEEVEKYGLDEGQAVQLSYLKKARPGKLAETKTTVLK